MVRTAPRTFIRDWSAAIRKQYPNYWMVGEALEEDSAHTAFFQGGRTGWDGIDTQLPSVFDFNLWKASTDVFTGKKPARALRDVLKYDGLYGNINNVALLTSNHDVDRFMSLPGATPEGAMMHMAFTLSSRGIPQIYYGDEIGMAGGHDPDNRKDFPGGFPGDSRDAFTKTGRMMIEQKMFAWTKEWIKIRRSRRPVKEGRTQDLYYDDEAYVFARSANGGTAPRINIFAFNMSNAEKMVSYIDPIVKGVPKITIPLKPKSASAFGDMLH